VKHICPLVLAVMLAVPVRAADQTVAAALGAAAAKLAAEGKLDKAKEICYKALANDEDAAEALYELGRIFEREGNAAAADFLVRAARQFAKEEAANPAFGGKRVDAERRVRALNPYALRYADVMTDYARELAAIAKKLPDAMTLEEAWDRITTLQLATVVPPEKMPVIERPAPKVVKVDKPDVPAPRPGPADGPGPRPSSVTPTEIVTNDVPVDVERALKAAGWSTISGTWRKKAENVYEVTNGKLEAPKVDGGVQVIVHKGEGTVKVMVRNARKDNPTLLPKDIKGYGYKITGNKVRVFSTAMYGIDMLMTTSSAPPQAYRDMTLSDANARNLFAITIQDGLLEMYINGKREHRSNYKLPKDGPFIIEVSGTATVESPKAAGQ